MHEKSHETGFSTAESCLICGSRDWDRLFTCTDRLVSGKPFPVLRCSACGMLRTGDAPGPGDMAGYYQSDDYVAHSDTQKGMVNRLYHLARQWMLGRKTALVQKYHGTGHGSILDYGCGTGHFLNAMRNRGWDIHGIEPGETARAFARERFSMALDPPDRLNACPDRSFDVITLWHVLEHLPDPHAVLNTLNAKLKPGGILILALPNALAFDARHYRQDWAAYDVPRHLWHFRPCDVQYLAEKQNWVRMTTRRMPLDGVYISMLSEMNRGTRLHTLRGMTWGALSLFLCLLQKQWCSSLITVFRKPHEKSS